MCSQAIGVKASRVPKLRVHKLKNSRSQSDQALFKALESLKYVVCQPGTYAARNRWLFAGMLRRRRHFQLSTSAIESVAAGKSERSTEEFFPEGHVKSNFLCNIGYGDPATLMPRSLHAYLTGREPVMRISTSLRALFRQSGPEATCDTPISARSRSNGTRSFRMSPVSMARSTNASIAPLI